MLWRKLLLVFIRRLSTLGAIGKNHLNSSRRVAWPRSFNLWKKVCAIHLSASDTLDQSDNNSHFPFARQNNIDKTVSTRLITGSCQIPRYSLAFSSIFHWFSKCFSRRTLSADWPSSSLLRIIEIYQSNSCIGEKDNTASREAQSKQSTICRCIRLYVLGFEFSSNRRCTFTNNVRRARLITFVFVALLMALSPPFSARISHLARAEHCRSHSNAHFPRVFMLHWQYTRRANKILGVCFS